MNNTHHHIQLFLVRPFRNNHHNIGKANTNKAYNNAIISSNNMVWNQCKTNKNIAKYFAGIFPKFISKFFHACFIWLELCLCAIIDVTSATNSSAGSANKKYNILTNTVGKLYCIIYQKSIHN